MEPKIESCGKCIRKVKFKKFKIMTKYGQILDNLETNIKYKLSEIIDEMHKHSIEDYISSLKHDIKIISEKETIESDYVKLIKHTLNVMFANIIEDFEMRIKSFIKEM